MFETSIGGIPESIFQQNRRLDNEPIKGLISGKELKCIIDPFHVHIWRDADERSQFIADVENGVLTLSIHTKRYFNGQIIHDPDLFATKLFHRTMQYFSEQGTQIEVIQGRWSKQDTSISDNYLDYQHGIESGLTPEQAVFNTWTGQRASEYGYTDAEVQESKDGVFVGFWKEYK